MLARKRAVHEHAAGCGPPLKHLETYPATIMEVHNGPGKDHVPL